MKKQNNETVERVFLYRDEDRHSKGLRAINGKLAIANSILKRFTKLLEEPVSEEMAYSVFTGKCESIEQLAHKQCRQKCITFPSVVKDAATKELTDAISLIYPDLWKLGSSDLIEFTDFLKYQEGQFIFDEDCKQRFDESCKVYLEDPAVIEKRKQHIAIVEALNDFFGDTIPTDWEDILSLNDEGRFEPNGYTNYELFV